MKSPDLQRDTAVVVRLQTSFKDFPLSSQASLRASVERQVQEMQSLEDQARKSPDCSLLVKVSCF